MSKLVEGAERLLCSTAQATCPDEVKYFDYLYLWKASERNRIFKYIAVGKDDVSSYCWLEPITAAELEQVAKILARWTRLFTVPEV